ncbi:hypothetical protein GCK72_017320 [Caenorhabditis remanei]|uniref:Exonuclease domain-containing protein n=1 Tax=Caenorhabditis remanei TaxID=31234 RepID=A0A6A5G8E1_CAERE|nr:hypothetical protein GCK72_017320 [Caenorhabditis remanei]KAF1750769.1 hypothetical protein GCK72_017320 [Caenorhabditis remanei]
MAKREMRKSLKWDIDNLFKSPETAEAEFQQAIKRRKLDDGTSSTPPRVRSDPRDALKPKLSLHLTRLGDGHRLDYLANLIHYCIFGSKSIQKPRWATISQHRYLLQTLVVRVNVEDNFFATTNLKFLNEFFDRHWLELGADISDRRLFWNSLMNVRLDLKEQIKRKTDRMQKTFDLLGKFDRSHFVLTTEQMAERNFPFPGEEGIVATKMRYKKITHSSPLYSVDCEMCETTHANRELTRISLIDEKQNTILDTLVKPRGDITDYVTRYSGITAEMMEGVTTTLEDVQRAIQNLLPPDAILVGHSLEHDLGAMKMTHPFCLDVCHSLNYTNNVFENRNSLKSLTEMFLGEQIQTEYGHCSYEDAWAALRLAQLKIQEGIVFGVASYGWKYSQYREEQKLKNGDGEILKLTQNSAAAPIPCTGCLGPTVVGCTVVNCRCRFVAGPAQCVACCVRNLVSEEGDFDWRETLEVDLEMERVTSPIENYVKKDKMKSVLMGFEAPEVLEKMPEMGRKIHLKLPSSFPTYSSFIDNVASEMLNDSAIFIEIDRKKVEPLPRSSPEDDEGEVVDNSEALNEILEKLVAATTKNAAIMMIFSSPSKNTLFKNIK